MAEGDYWSIGEVLSLLQDEFPEITISKIRFLESQGLIQPERTPSGYRRFYQSDFDLLHWILVQQRDHYLPLKVIRDRIQSGEVEQGLLDFSGDGTAPPEDAMPPTAAKKSVGSDAAATKTAEPKTTTKAASSGNEKTQDDEHANGAVPKAKRSKNKTAHSGGADTAKVPASTPTADAEPAGAAAESVPRMAVASSVAEAPDADTVAEPLPPLALTRDELAESSGCSVKMIGDLERYGLVKGRKAGPTVLYDNTALLISRIAAQFDTFGLEPRHLRTFLIGAEREMGLVHQVVEPMLHRRDEETRRKAHETLDDLTDLAGSLRSILMRQAAEELLPKH